MGPLAHASAADHPAARTRAFSRQRARLAAEVTVLLVAIGVLIGWQFDIATLKTILPNYISMKANTAIGFILLALASWFARDENVSRNELRLSHFCSRLVFLIGALTLIEYAFSINLGIDEFFYIDLQGHGKPIPPGRLAPVTAVSFMLLAVAHGLLIYRRYKIAQGLTILAFTISFQAFVGYLIGVTYSFGSLYYTQMALHTTILFSIICFAKLASRSEHGIVAVFLSDTAGGFMARRMICFALTVPPCLTWVQINGQRNGLFNEDFGVLLRVLGNVAFLTLMVWRTSMALHRTDSERAQSQTQEQSARQASELKTQFLANMSHEIRTPINGILGLTEMLQDTSLRPEQRELTEVIKRSADALLFLVNDILDISKIEAGKMQIEAVDFNLSHLIGDLAKTYAVLAAQKSIQFSVGNEISPDLKYVQGDPGRIRQVLMNLLNNALKFTAVGGRIELTVRAASVAPSESRFYFAVADTGIGVSTEAKSRLFQPFMQADASTSRTHGGTGLGLSICQRLVKLMSGEIGLESEVGVGSKFWFTVNLPPSRDVDRVAAASSIALQPALRPGALVLVAEDNPVNQKVALYMLEKMGYRAHAVFDGEEAVAAFTRVPYDLILMDCQMPNLDGYEATRKIRTISPAGAQIPIIAMTANATYIDRQRCLDAGMNDYISKPAKIAELSRMLNLWMPALSAPESDSVA